MLDSGDIPETDQSSAPQPSSARRSRGEPRESLAELAAKAQEISEEAGARVATAMGEVIGAASGVAGFAVESARDLVQYMIRRGQMSPDDGEKLLRDAEQAAQRQPAKPRPPRPTARGSAAPVTADARSRGAPSGRAVDQPATSAKAEERPVAAPGKPARGAKQAAAGPSTGSPAGSARKAGAPAAKKVARSPSKPAAKSSGAGGRPAKKAGAAAKGGAKPAAKSATKKSSATKKRPAARKAPDRKTAARKAPGKKSASAKRPARRK